MEESTAAGSCLPVGTLPVLVYDHGFDPNNQKITAFAIGDQSLHTSFVPELADNYYHVTPHGWVLLVAPGPSPRTRLWDPRSGESVPLPAMERELPDDWKCYLSAAPTASPPCVVLVLHKDEPKLLYCRVGDGRWSEHEYDIGEVKLPPPPRKIVIEQTAAVGGKFYFRETAKLGVIDFSPAAAAAPEFSFIDYHPRAEYPDGSNIRREYMIESQGELFFVYLYLKGYTPEIMTVRVYRMDLSSSGPTLIEVDEVGDRVFLLSYPNSQLLCSASKYGLKGNRVYFTHNPTGELDGGLLGIYDMEDQSVETLKPCPRMEELFRGPFWMLPTSTTDQ
ncbi:unnamed protein product [Urochloa decumbens]|uniref:KIB1-4 beta-propeller domain-containing protein n=1 Tax=Urochloa decumbens TaxID=240449 RepID=A0ABC8YR82_9POAL